VQPSIATIDRPAGRLVATQQALLVQPGIGARTVQLVAAVQHGAQRLTALLVPPAHQLLERGEHVHTFGNQRHGRRPELMIQTSHHNLHLGHSKVGSLFGGTLVALNTYRFVNCEEDIMKYGVAWLLGVPGSLIVLWFVANQMGCGF
jgi:hypothetical protein